jgi:2-polyprenyl-3-methyl-5-hydroxy-6-metoxy-1,4-benzoquinol methylase
MPDENVSITDQPANIFTTFARLPLRKRIIAKGEIVWPAVPALLDLYVECVANIFALLGRAFEGKELFNFRQTFQQHLNDAFGASPNSKVRVEYFSEPAPGLNIRYAISHRVDRMEDEYHKWSADRTPPLFGGHSDAKVTNLVRLLGDPKSVSVLDVGAGTGRNAIPLAREGFQVGAVEIVRSLVDTLHADAEREGVKMDVFVGDAFDPELGIPERRYNLVVLAEVVASHFRNKEQLRTMFERAADWLVSSGLLVFSCFLSEPGYVPTAIDRDLSEVCWCPIFAREDLEAAVEGVPLTPVSDESVYDFEKEHLDSSAWPPTSWFEDWTTGRDLFDTLEKTPIELRWIVYQRN